MWNVLLAYPNKTRPHLLIRTPVENVREIQCRGTRPGNPWRRQKRSALAIPDGTAPTSSVNAPARLNPFAKITGSLTSTISDRY